MDQPAVNPGTNCRRVKVQILYLCFCVLWHTVPALCDPMDYTVHVILQARKLEWVAFPFSRGSSQTRGWTQVSHITSRFFASWATREAQEYWSGLPIPSPVDLLTQESNQGLLHCRQILYQLSYQGSPFHPPNDINCKQKKKKDNLCTIWFLKKTMNKQNFSRTNCQTKCKSLNLDGICPRIWRNSRATLQNCSHFPKAIANSSHSRRLSSSLPTAP